MPRTNFQELLDAGVHFGHLARKWNPKMAPYIFDQKNGIHIIDLHKSIVKIDEAANVLKQLARSGRKVLFVSTKKQAKEIVADKAASVNMPYVTERWPGGMLTNFPTIRKAVKKMNTIDKMIEDGTFATLAKRERLQVTRQRAKLEKNLGSIRDLSRLPSALFVVDVQKEMNAVKEANRLNIPVIAMVDTCCDPTPIDYVIPANDDAAKSIAYIMDALCGAIKEGLDERKLEKNLGSIRDLSRLPSALFVVDVQKEMNAVKEANRLNIPVIAMVDTCCDPTPIDYVIPANDDAAKSIAYIMEALCGAIKEGLDERKLEKEKETPEQTEEKPAGKKLRARKGAKPAEAEAQAE